MTRPQPKNPYTHFHEVPLFFFTTDAQGTLYLRGETEQQFLWLRLQEPRRGKPPEHAGALHDRPAVPPEKAYQPLGHVSLPRQGLSAISAAREAWYIEPRHDTLALHQPYLDHPPSVTWVTPDGEVLRWTHVRLRMTGGEYSSVVLTQGRDPDRRFLLPVTAGVRQLCLSLSGQREAVSYTDEHERTLSAQAGVLHTPWGNYPTDLNPSRLARTATLCGTRPLTEADFRNLT